MTQPRYIVGAGLAGLIAAHAWPTARVLEAQAAPAQMHKALLRFRSDAVGRLTGIEFRKVRVHKGIWLDGAYVAPNIAVANLYASKCLGALVGDRSIWSVDAVDRWVAPDDFYGQMIANVGPRIDWGTPIDWRKECNPFAEDAPPIVSTAPMPEVLANVGGEGVVKQFGFKRAPIHVLRGTVPGADVYQTAYFPSPETGLYRASLCGERLIAEFIGGAPGEQDSWASELRNAFGLSPGSWSTEESVAQRYGKIAPIPDPERRGLLFSLTHHHGIFSLGRFATWRNILLDDVVSDIDVIKRLMRTGSVYDMRREQSAAFE